MKSNQKGLTAFFLITFLIASLLFNMNFTSASTTVLKKGDRDSDVVKLKENLAKAGFTVPGNGTTYFGSKTEGKVKEFQKYYGLERDGYAGPITNKKLNSIVNSPLQRGKRHKNTVQLKKDLASIGYKVPGKGTNYYGPKTERQVKSFQKDKRLVVNGIADGLTLKKIKALVVDPNNLKNGDRHAKVKTLKTDLAILGFTVPGNGTTYFGPKTEKKVKEFQSYYSGLTVDGLAGPETLGKIKKILNSPLQRGKRHKETVKLKKDLASIGYKVPGKGTTYFGPKTEEKVKEFQEDKRLVVNGIADEPTLKKIKALVVDPNNLKNGNRHHDVKILKERLAKFGFPVPGNGTTYFGPETEKKVREFQKYNGLKVDGIAGPATFGILDSPLQNKRWHQATKLLKKDLKAIGYKVPGNGTTLFGKETEKKVKKFQKDKKLIVNGVVDEVTLREIGKLVKKKTNKIRIFLDPGHGGRDSGAKGNNLLEKNITLNIALKVEKQLKDSRFEVVMSRRKDETKELYERSIYANNSNSDAFVSIHVNAGGGTGIETWKYEKGPNPEESKKLADSIQDEVINETSVRSRGVRDKNLHVNRESNMPSSLVEVMFIDTKEDADKLKDRKFINRVVKGITNGIKNYFK